MKGRVSVLEISNFIEHADTFVLKNDGIRWRVLLTCSKPDGSYRHLCTATIDEDAPLPTYTSTRFKAEIWEL